MSLGRREARHQTVAAARTAGVTPEDYWSFKPGEKVMTADGFAGTVASVDDGPIGGTETYDVVLDNGMGGGQYTASLLRAMPQSTANVDIKTAADDYPELGTILVDRPPLALSTKGSLQAEAAYDHGDPDEYTSGHRCPNCGSDRSLESANGVIKCEDCGYAKQNGQTDGWGGPEVKTAAAAEPIKHTLPAGATCARCGYGNVKAKPGDSCLLCDGQMSKQPEKIVHALLDDPYRLLIVAAADDEFRFHVTASWSDVRNKAKRIRSEGHVNIISASNGTVVANVKGDTAVYETEIVRMGSNAIAQWHCGCKWGSYAWGRQPAFKRFEGRLCSHAFALHLEAQAQGMFGRTVQEEEKRPAWIKDRTRIVTDFDRDERKNVSRPAQPRKRDMRAYALAEWDETAAETLVRTALEEGVSEEEIGLSFRTAGLVVEAAKPEGYQTTAPGSHHKDRSGDLAPCANGGCGHPEGIHGEEGGDCNSQGCECKHYVGVGSAKEARRHKKKRKTKRHTVRMSYGAPWHGIGVGYWGGWGYGHGGYYSPGETGGSGGDGGGDGGGGDGGSTAALGDVFPIFKQADFPGTMDPTYTEGNEPRHWDKSNGAWGATVTPNPNSNPGSTGFATSGDPKEFDVDSSAFGRMGSRQTGWPEVPGIQVEAVAPLALLAAPAAAAAGRAALTWTVKKVGPKLVKKVAPKVINKAKEIIFRQPKGPKGGPKGGPKQPKGEKPGGKGRGGRGPRPRGGVPLFFPDIPQLPKPNYDVMSDSLKGQFQLQRGSALIAELMRQEEVMLQAEAALTDQERFANGVADNLESLGGPSLPRFAEPGDDDLNAIVQQEAIKDRYAGASSFEASLHDEVVTKNVLAEEAKHGIEALLDEDPEPALPSTDGDLDLASGLTPNPRVETDPDGDAAGMASHGSVVKQAWDREEWDERYDEHERDDDPCTKCEGTGLKPSTSGAVDRTCGECDGSGQAPQGRRTASAEAPSGESVEEIVAQFQATAGALAIASGSAPGNAAEGDDVASAAKAFLAKESMKTFAPHEQKEIIDEGMDVKAANLDRLNIEGTHYEALEAALASQTDDDDLEL